jgi:DNA-binding SARP family transcriptional activator
LREAVALYAGPFLEDIQEDWVMERRRELESVYLQTLVDLGDCCFQIGDAHEAESWYRQALDIDDYREDIHRKVMLALAQGGRRAEALRQYQVCADILLNELGIEPDPATQALAHDIRSSSL